MDKQQSMVSTIKKGFFLGLGAVIPFAVLEVASVKYAFHEGESFNAEIMETFNKEINLQDDFYKLNQPKAESTTESDSATTSTTTTATTTSATPSFEDSFANYNRSYDKEIRLSEYQTNIQNGRLLVTGSLTNEAKIAVNSVEIEAELFKGGTFVYECSDYISKTIESGQSENYMIKCGCSKGDTPEFDEVKVKVSKASRY